jgi:hypothetical protein
MVINFAYVGTFDLSRRTFKDSVSEFEIKNSDARYRFQRTVIIIFKFRINVCKYLISKYGKNFVIN